VNHLLIIAHAPLASALRGFALHAYPELAAHISAYDVPDDEAREASTRHALALLPAEDDVLVCADVFGASPFFVAQAVAAQRQAKLLVGATAPCPWPIGPLKRWKADSAGYWQ
jgi:PTS system ascorbate-specific IIA component